MSISLINPFFFHIKYFTFYFFPKNCTYYSICCQILLLNLIFFYTKKKIIRPIINKINKRTISYVFLQIFLTNIPYQHILTAHILLYTVSENTFSFKLLRTCTRWIDKRRTIIAAKNFQTEGKYFFIFTSLKILSINTWLFSRQKLF